ncbi:MAG TPA: enoyl-CoA hydratase/isomerase family protein [Syntrophomonadaceae bacterium]|nr:enoyl-CoA hydratase/isomerase family protein [Syntrophomonadaceae bacterium]HPR94401.1 enoyl-CoA hydratase/isomerase family protein [Syntrophomonadaceae bacterium]
MAPGDWFIFEMIDNVAVLTLNHPESMNIVNRELFYEMHEMQNKIEADPSIRAVVIKANGPHFSAGIDLNLLKSVDSQFVAENLNFLQRLYGRWQEWHIPVIAAVHGICYGSAVELILGCDVRVASDDLRISIPEVRFGLSPDMGGTVRLTQLVGMGQAKRMILGCEELNAQEALQIGLVEIVVPRDKLEERAIKLARRMAGMPPMAIRFAKRGINLANESSLAAGLAFEQAQSVFCCGTEDQTEAINSFFEKRKPEFKGK